jgi:cellobiose-specific phosphotransferase system component IIC
MVYSLNGTAQSQRVTRVIRTFFGPLSPIHSRRYSAVLASLIPILWASGIGSNVMKPIAAPMVGGMITSTIRVLILVPVFFVLMKERSLRRGTLQPVPVE